MNTSSRDTAALRAANTSRILTQIRRRRETSRVDLSKDLDLSPTTVSAVVQELVGDGLVLETHSIATPGRGRPKKQVSLNPNARYVAGAKLNAEAVTVAILNFAGDVLADTAVELGVGMVDPNAMLLALEKAFGDVVTDAGLNTSDIAGFGLGVPGFVERETGYCHWSPILKGAPLNLKELLQPHIPCPVHVDNDANLATLAELWFGYGRDHRDFLVVTIEHGVGLGVVIDGQLYRGARGLGAEFGHIKVQVDGALCRCGQRGCLEAYVADFALMREAEAALQGLSLPNESSGVIDLLADQARSGEEVAASIFRRAGRMLGLGLANLLNLFDPGIVVLAGERMRNHALLQKSLEETLHASTIRTERLPVQLAVHRWGDGLWARGAGALALEAVAAEPTSRMIAKAS